MKDLAVVIPAYKEIYFEKTLNSFAEQTNNNFTIYIGDDFSPYNLKKIVDKFKDKLDINYTRFSFNIGSKDLVLQWKRCIELTKDEKWLWLFSDDDLVDNNCVENFYLTVEENQPYDVYRFNTITIDKDDKFTYQHPLGPLQESSEEMAYHLLIGNRGNSMPDHIFSREIYDLSGGFVFTKYAQGADWAISILYSKNRGMRIIQGSKVSWRYSGNNVSSFASGKRNEMIDGHLEFITWAKNHFDYLKHKTHSTISYELMLEALKINLSRVLIFHYKGYNWGDIFKLANFYHKTFNVSLYNSFKELGKVKEANNIWVARLYCLISSFKKYL